MYADLSSKTIGNGISNADPQIFDRICPRTGVQSMDTDAEGRHPTLPAYISNTLPPNRMKFMQIQRISYKPDENTYILKIF